MYGFSLEKEKKSFFCSQKQQGRRVHKADTDHGQRLWPKGGGHGGQPCWWGHKNAQIPIGTHNFFEPSQEAIWQMGVLLAMRISPPFHDYSKELALRNVIFNYWGFFTSNVTVSSREIRYIMEQNHNQCYWLNSK